VADAAIINASPLIFLARSQHLELLKFFAREIWIPEPVAEEILARGMSDVTARAMRTTPWLIQKPAAVITLSILEWRLGPGESGVLALAHQYPGTEAILDDLAGRKCAASLGIPIRGTLGIVLVAKQRGLITHARPVLEDMLQTGMYLSRKVLDQALARVGE